MAPGKALWRFLGLALIAGLSVRPCSAQDPKENKDDAFWEIRHQQEVGAAAQMVLARNPLTIAILRNEGLRWKVWLEPEFLADTAPALNDEWLDDILDGKPIPDVRGRALDELRKDQRALYKIWNQAVIFANTTPPDAFAKSAKEHSHVTFAHLWTDPGKYRGKVIPIKGRLKRLRKYDAPLEAQKQGVKFAYEGWVYGPTDRSHPFCIVFPNLPEGLTEAENMEKEVSFHGYFILKMKYPAGDKSKYLETPFLIGPTVTLKSQPAPQVSATPISMTVVACVLGVVVAAGASLMLLSWYFRRGDLEIKTRLAQMQAERAMAALENEDTDAVPDQPKSP